jgi:FtsH-binding integral membrane protein
MKEIVNKLKNDSRWQPVLVFLGNLIILEFIIFPGLTVSSTFINMLCVLIFIALFLFDLNYVKEKYFTKSEEEKQFQSEWNEKKEEMEEKLKNQKDK